MDAASKTSKYRKTPIASLVTAIFSLAVFSFQAFQTLFFGCLFTGVTRQIFGLVFVAILGLILPLIAITLGSIDLKRFKKGIHRVKLYRGFDITGIVLGSFTFMIVAVSNLGPVLVSNLQGLGIFLFVK